jgi:hypothetical protein
MGHWAIYVTDPDRIEDRYGEERDLGELWGVTARLPDCEDLRRRGLACVYFGVDEPDLLALEWCPKRLTFVARAPIPSELSRLDSVAGELARLHARVGSLEVFARRPTLKERVSRFTARFRRGKGVEGERRGNVDS